MAIKRWRDVALRYDDDPSTKLVTAEEKRRLIYLSLGVRDALTADLQSLTKDALMAANPTDLWSYSDAKKAEVRARAVQFKQKVKKKVNAKAV